MSSPPKPEPWNQALLPWYARPYVDLQYILPHRFLSAIAYRLALSQSSWVKNFLISQVISRYGVDMTQALEVNLAQYRNFQEFFNRRLRPETRPFSLGPERLASPVDGSISQFGAINNGQLFQAKNRHYLLSDLLGADEEWGRHFVNGFFITLTMDLGDSHRIYMPMDGELVRMRHVPGHLFAVNPITTRLIPRVLIGNERVICLFETPAGPMAIILIGTLFTGGISTAWSGTVAPATRRIARWDYTASQRQIRLQQGMELGYFNLGSAIIILLGAKNTVWDSQLEINTKIQLGTQIASIKN